MKHGITFVLTIDMGNDDMQTNADVARALEEVAAKLETGNHLFSGSFIKDSNGNTVGQFEYIAGKVLRPIQIKLG